jgi:hypothetical protein
VIFKEEEEEGGKKKHGEMSGILTLPPLGS